MFVTFCRVVVVVVAVVAVAAAAAAAAVVVDVISTAVRPVFAKKCPYSNNCRNRCCYILTVANKKEHLFFVNAGSR